MAGARGASVEQPSASVTSRHGPCALWRLRLPRPRESQNRMLAGRRESRVAGRGDRPVSRRVKYGVCGQVARFRTAAPVPKTQGSSVLASRDPASGAGAAADSPVRRSESQVQITPRNHRVALAAPKRERPRRLASPGPSGLVAGARNTENQRALPQRVRGSWARSIYRTHRKQGPEHILAAPAYSASITGRPSLRSVRRRCGSVRPRPQRPTSRILSVL